MEHRCVDVYGGNGGLQDWHAIEATFKELYPMDDMPAGIHKVTEGINFLDGYAARNIASLKAAGKLAVGYHCLRSSDAVEQAKWFVAHADTFGCDGLMLDWETFGGDSPTAVQAEKFLHAVEDLSNLPIIVYTAEWYVSRKAVGRPTPYIASFPLQLGNPFSGNYPREWPGWAGWQYGSEIGLPGSCNLLSEQWISHITGKKETNMVWYVRHSNGSIYEVTAGGKVHVKSEADWNLLTACGAVLTPVPDDLIDAATTVPDSGSTTCRFDASSYPRVAAGQLTLQLS